MSDNKVSPINPKLQDLREVCRIFTVHPTFEGGEEGGAVRGPYLDNSCHKSPFPNQPWSRRKKRFFQRAMSGIEIAWGNREEVRFLSLTSSPESPDLHGSFAAFVKRARREFGRFEYVAVKEYTQSGLAHLHILFRGCFMPFEWVKANWSDIHKAKIVYLEKVYGKKREVACYLAKYLGKESLSRYRFWCSSKWCFRGFVGFWRKTVHAYQEQAVRKWTYFLNGGVLRFVKWHTPLEYEYWKFDRGKAMPMVADLTVF
jgi:hypothetical protein